MMPQRKPQVIRLSLHFLQIAEFATYDYICVIVLAPSRWCWKRGWSYFPQLGILTLSSSNIPCSAVVWHATQFEKDPIDSLLKTSTGISWCLPRISCILHSGVMLLLPRFIYQTRRMQKRRLPTNGPSSP